MLAHAPDNKVTRGETLITVIPGRATDFGFTRDRHLILPKSARADLGGAGPESISSASVLGFRARHAFALRTTAGVPE
jgi:hypothetical protein